MRETHTECVRLGMLAHYRKYDAIWMLYGWKYFADCGIRGKFSVSELHWKFQGLTEIGRITVVMFVQFVDRKLQLTDYRDPSTKLGFWVGTRLKRQQKRAKKCRNLVALLANEPPTKGSVKNFLKTEFSKISQNAAMNKMQWIGSFLLL